MPKAKRSQFMTFLNTSTSGSTAKYERMGKGITGQTVEYNPQTTTEQYIHEDNATTSVDSYQPNLPTTQTVYPGDPCYDFVDGIRKGRKVGGDCKADMLMVNAYEDGVEGAYSAEKCECVVAINSFGGEGNLAITYTVYLNGDPVEGTFSPSTKAFTAS